MKELMFWQEAKNLVYTGVVDDKLPAREFPSTDVVHYFHPISWVRQMKLRLDKLGKAFLKTTYQTKRKITPWSRNS